MERPKFDRGETQKFFNTRFNREFENTTFDTFRPDNPRRCIDKFGDSGWVVGEHKALVLDRQTIPHWNWVIRDRDKALIGIHDEMLRIESDADRYDRARHYPKRKHNI
jgi:hypothetical protein